MPTVRSGLAGPIWGVTGEKPAQLDTRNDPKRSKKADRMSVGGQKQVSLPPTAFGWVNCGYPGQAKLETSLPGSIEVRQDSKTTSLGVDNTG